MVINLEHLEAEYKKRISRILTDGFELNLLSAAFVNLSEKNPLRFNNFAYTLRELLRHVLHRLAPDLEVSQCIWYKPDPSSSTGFTRHQRIKYAIQGGLSDFYVTKRLGLDEIKDRIHDLLRIIKILNGYTHIEPDTFDIGDSDTESLAGECLEAASGFVEKMGETRGRIFDTLLDDIDKTLFDRAVSVSVEEILALSTHQSIDDIYSDGGHVVHIGPKSLTVHVSGHLECELQYGSNSDMRRGDGATISESFPFDGKIIVKLEAPLGSVTEIGGFNVDTSGWYK